MRLCEKTMKLCRICHKEYHKKMTEALIRHLSPEETELLVKALTNLKDFFEEYRKEEEK